MKWIPVSERLPVGNNAVLITIGLFGDSHDPLVPYMTADYDCDWGWYFTDNTPVQDKVLAWMPLPNPYEVEQE